MHRLDDSLYHYGANKEIVEALVSNKVEFTLIGGLAVSWYWPERRADDMDLLVEPSIENSNRVAMAVQSIMKNRCDSGAFARHGVRLLLKQWHNAEIMTPAEGGQTYKELTQDANEGKLFKIPIKIASIAALITMKNMVIRESEPGFEKHVKDVEFLSGITNR